MLTDTEVDFKRLQQAAATHSHNHYLAAVKHAAEVVTLRSDDWPAMVCCNDCYIEAVFIKDVELLSIVTVRIRDAEYKRLVSLAFEEYTQSHGDATHSLKADFVRILRAENDGHYGVEKV